MKKKLLSHILSMLAVAGILNSYDGTNVFMGHKETYYNKPMAKVVQNAKSNGIEGDYWERPEDGVKMYGKYVICAASQDVHPYASIVGTSLGPAIVLDTGSFRFHNPQLIDIATCW